MLLCLAHCKALFTSLDSSSLTSASHSDFILSLVIPVLSLHGLQYIFKFWLVRTLIIWVNFAAVEKGLQSRKRKSCSKREAWRITTLIFPNKRKPCVIAPCNGWYYVWILWIFDFMWLKFLLLFNFLLELHCFSKLISQTKPFQRASEVQFRSLGKHPQTDCCGLFA